jgi:hypothetical protein
MAVINLVAAKSLPESVPFLAIFFMPLLWAPELYLSTTAAIPNERKPLFHPKSG